MHKKSKPSRSSTNSNCHLPSRGGNNSDSQSDRIESLLRGEGKYSSSQSPTSTSTHQYLGVMTTDGTTPQTRCSNKRRYSRDSTTSSSSIDYHPSASVELSPRLHGIDEGLFNSINAHRDLIPSEEDFLAYAVAEIYLSELRKFSPDRFFLFDNIILSDFFYCVVFFIN